MVFVQQRGNRGRRHWLSSARPRWLFSRSRRGALSISSGANRHIHSRWNPGRHYLRGETFNPRTYGYYSTTEYGYIDGQRSSSPETVAFLRFYPDGTFCKQHANIGNRPSDDDVMASLTRSGKNAIGSQAQCGTWDSTSYQYTAPAGLAHSEVVSVADSGFTAIAPVLMENIHIRQEFLFQAVG